MTTTARRTAGPRRKPAYRARCRALVAMTVPLFVMTAGQATAQESGLTADKLERAGWTCIDQAGQLPTPCLPDAESVFAGEAASSVVLTFGPDGREFWGTEHLVHRDLYNGQPCPRDEVAGGDGGYLDLQPLNGLPYFVCHHFDSPVT